MKTSTIFIITAIVISLAIVTVYNFSLKASYQTGSYKDRFYGLSLTPIQGVKALHLNSANRFEINLECGKKEGLWIREEIKDKIKVDQTGDVLTLDLTDAAKKERFTPHVKDIILITNHLQVLNATPYFTKDEIDENSLFSTGIVRIEGLNGPSLDLTIGAASQVYLSNVKVNTLNAHVYGNKLQSGLLLVDHSNEIELANLNVPGAGDLNLSNPKITKILYNLSDSANVTLNGSALKSIRN